MSRYVFYHKDTGVLHGQVMQFFVSDLDNYVKNNTPAHHVALEHENAHPGHHRFDIESKQVVEAIPPAPSADHEWNVGRHRWTLKPAIVEARQAMHDRVGALLEEQRKTVVGFLLGRGGADRLREIETELSQLTDHAA